MDNRIRRVRARERGREREREDGRDIGEEGRSPAGEGQSHRDASACARAGVQRLLSLSLSLSLCERGTSAR